MTVKDIIQILKKLPQDENMVDRRMLAMTKNGDVYNLSLRCRLVGIGQFPEGVAFILEYNEELAKIADITKLS